MKAILFLKTKDGQYLFKGDSFWSKGVDPDFAKVYSNDSITEVERWLKNGVFPWNIYSDKIQTVINRYSDGILGYFTPSDDMFKDSYSIKDGATIEDLGDPKLLYIVKVRPFSDWIIEKEEESIMEDGSLRKSITPKSDSVIYFEDLYNLTVMKY